MGCSSCGSNKSSGSKGKATMSKTMNTGTKGNMRALMSSSSGTATYGKPKITFGGRK